MQTTSFESHLVAEAERRREALAAEAPGSEAARRVDPEIASDLAAQGHFTMLAPRELGGGEVSPRTFTQTLYELGRGDPALAWCVMTGSTTSLLTAWLPEAGAREVLGDDGRGILAGIFAPLGRARRVEGGVRLTGRWPFASGCENAAWRMGGAFLVGDDGRPLPGPEGAPEILSMFFPAEESEVIDTWNVSGLRGTGSHDVAVADVFVPERRIASLMGSRPRRGGRLYAFPVFGLLASGVSAVSLGVARAALDAFAELARHKRPAGGRQVLAESELVQYRVAEAEAAVGAALAFQLATAEQVWERASPEAALGIEDRAALRLAASHAVKAATEAVGSVYQLAGGGALYEDSAIGRHFRDVHAITQHVMVAPATLRTVGRVLLGQPAGTAQL